MRNWFLHIVFGVLALQLQAQCSCDSLVAAIKAEDTIAVKECLESGTNPNCWVLRYENEHEEFFGKGEDYVWEWMDRPMAFAIRKNNIALVKQLHKEGASVNTGSVRLLDTLGTPRFMLYRVPLMLADSIIKLEEDSTVYNYLVAHGAVSHRTQFRRGEMIEKLFFSDVVSEPYYMNSLDSLKSFNKLLLEYGDAIIFPQEPTVLAAAFSSNVPSLQKWILANRDYRLLQGKSLYRLNQTFDVWKLALYGEYLSARSISFYKLHFGLTEESIERDMSIIKSRHEYVYEYLQLEKELQDPNVRKREKKENKLYRIGLVISMENDFPDRL